MPSESALDTATQRWVRLTGRDIDLGLDPWLAGPVGDPTLIGDSWLDSFAEHVGAHLVEGGGLLTSLDDLASDTFDPNRVAAGIRSFYEETSSWTMEVVATWSTAARPLGWLVTRLFAQRLQQLGVPLGTGGSAQPIESSTVAVVGPDNRALGAAWTRTLTSTGQTMYSGLYGITRLPQQDQPSLRVCFPLPHGNLSVFLHPAVEADGSLVLRSPKGAFGEDGAYLTVGADGSRMVRARRIPITERFVIGSRQADRVSTEHQMWLGSLPFLRLSYLLRKGPNSNPR